MKRIGRTLFHLVAILSLLLCIAASAAWVLGHRRVDVLSFAIRDNKAIRDKESIQANESIRVNESILDTQSTHLRSPARLVQIHNTGGIFYLAVSRSSVDETSAKLCRHTYPSNICYSRSDPYIYENAMHHRDFMLAMPGLRVLSSSKSFSSTKILIRHPLLVAMTAPMPLWSLATWMARRRSSRRRRRVGLCRSCGYDLRASTGRCSECGVVIQTA